MKFTPKIQAALQTLKNAAENDFERHRIAVLEKDLTAPPTVEIIDDTHQKFDGVIYHEFKSRKHYFHQSSIHRAVYAYYFGEIPKNYDIHHIDENPANNDISNLQLLNNAEHAKIHSFFEKSIEYTCKVCGKKFSKRMGKRFFCSKQCANSFRKNKYREKRNCLICGKEFETYKHSTQKCCCRSCGIKLRNQTVRKNNS